MKTLISIAVCLSILFMCSLQAQDFQGTATYKTHRSVEIAMDSTKINSEMQKKMIEMMKKQFQKTYVLNFNKEASTYTEEPSLEKPKVGAGDMQIVMIDSGSSDILYKNISNNTYSSQHESWGKLFLVKDTLASIDWKLESESKYIGEYLCYKATYTKKVKKPTIHRSFEDANKSEDDKTANEPEMEEITVTAWYTPQIPVNNGPEHYQGLPGLILEIHDDKLTIICSKIILNPKDKMDIEEPKKGKAVDQKTYDEIIEKKLKEMMERFRPIKGRPDGETIHIKIGG